MWWGIVAMMAAGAAQGEVSAITFVKAAGSPIAVAGATDLLARDLDGDGRMDLAVATRAGVVVLRGDGAGRFGPAAAPLAGSGPAHLVAAGDLDRDGRLDLVATSHGTHDVSAWRGTAAGGFEPMPWSPIPALPAGPAHNHGLALGDLDGDGWLDVTTADDEAHVVAVLRGGPEGPRPATPRSFTVGNSPYPHALGDLDGDGDLDLVAPNTGGASVSVLLGDGKGSFVPAPGSPVSVPPRPFFVALGDFDASGRLDVVVTHDDRTTATILLGDGSGRLRAGPPLAVGHRSWKAAVADLDADGRADLALAGDGRLALWAGDGRGAFRPFPGSPIRAGGGSWSLAAADFDGDGRLDLAAADVETGTVSVFLSRPPVAR
jgi:hypothetical protein